MTKEEKQAYNKAYAQANKEKLKAYREANRDKRLDQSRASNERHKEKRKADYHANKDKHVEYNKSRSDKRKAYMKTYNEKRKDYYKEYRKLKKSYPTFQIKYNTDNLFKLKHIIRVLIGQSIRKKGYTKHSRTSEILGCTFLEFKQHIETQWQDWMTWDNYGKYDGNFNTGWDIDHIVPVSSAATEDELIRLNNYTNLQPLCSKVNRDIKKANTLFILN